MNVNGLNGIKDFAPQRLYHRKAKGGDEGISSNSLQKNASKGGFHLFIGGLTSYGSADGSNVTIYKGDSYTSNNPELKIVQTYPDGSKVEKFVDPREIDPSNATEAEMLALNSYLVTEGKIGSDILQTGILQGTGMSSDSISDIKKNYMDNVNELMLMQYHAGNLKGYAKYSKILGAYTSFLDHKK